jgi:hypothetical protein
MCLTTQATQPTTGINLANIWPNGLEGRKCSSLCLNLANNVLSNSNTHRNARSVKPLPLLNNQIARNSRAFLVKRFFVTLSFLERGNGFVDFVALWACGGAKTFCGRESRSSRGLGGEEVTHEDLAVGEGLFDYKCVTAVVLEGIGKRGCFECALGEMKIPNGSYGCSEFAVGQG